MRSRHGRNIGATGPATCRGFITELIERCARRDEDALGRLVDLLQPLVLAASASHFPDRRADDVAVEVFVRVWQEAPTYDGRQVGPVAWILGQLPDVPGTSTAALASEPA